MRAAIVEYNAELAQEGLGPLALGIGIHRGLGLAGLVGSRDRMDYDFIGHSVSLAARVEALTRVHGVDILVTEAVRSELDKRFILEPMPPQLVKGIAEPVITYAVRGDGQRSLSATRRKPQPGNGRGLLSPLSLWRCQRQPPASVHLGCGTGCRREAQVAAR